MRDAIHSRPFLSGSGFDASLKQIWSDVCTFFPYGDSDAEKLAASVAASADPVVLCLSMRAQNKFHEDIGLVRDFLDLFGNRSLVVVKYDTDKTIIPTATRVTGGLKAQRQGPMGPVVRSHRPHGGGKGAVRTAEWVNPPSLPVRTASRWAPSPRASTAEYGAPRCCAWSV